MTTPEVISISSESHETSCSQTHKDWMILLWTLRVAIHIPETLDREKHRVAADTILALIAPWVRWPESLLQDFSSHLKDQDPDVEHSLDLTETNPLDGSKRQLHIHKQLSDIDCSLLSNPFQKYYRQQKNKINRLFEAAEREIEAQACHQEGVIVHNTTWLSGLIGLNEAETAFLLLSLYFHECAEIKTIFGSIPFRGTRKAAAQLGRILGQESSAIQRAMNPGSKLYGLGMFKEHYHVSDLDDLIPYDRKVHSVLGMEHPNVESLVGIFLEPSKGTDLTPDDFSHMKDALDDLSSIIKNALVKREEGINILFYGPPGTGKTQLSRLIAKTIGYALYEVRWSDDMGEPATSTERLMGLDLGQIFLKTQSNAFLVFDEVEAVFEGNDDGIGSLSRLFGGRSHARNAKKAWINQSLDNKSAVPTIWIANEIERFDPAFLRRFIYCLEFKIPPRRVRRLAIDRYLRGCDLSASFRERLAAQWISPAQIEMALRSTQLLNVSNQEEAEIAVLRAIKSSMAVMGQTFLEEDPLSSRYRLDYLNVESPIPIEKWPEIARNGHPVSICLAGPPGAGKSQLAHYLADQLDKPLLAKRGSDLLSKWVGGTEARLAAMFQEAREEQAILLLDEADSILRNREQATQGWQVSQVNELLQQMEAFKGILICTTNRYEDLDPAALRRFSLKVRFHAMTPNQRWAFLLELTGNATDDFPEASSIRGKLDRLEGVTPGDFAVAARHFQMLNMTPDPHHLLMNLEQEVRAKHWNCPQRSIGFLH